MLSDLFSSVVTKKFAGVRHARRERNVASTSISPHFHDDAIFTKFYSGGLATVSATKTFQIAPFLHNLSSHQLNIYPNVDNTLYPILVQAL